MVILKMITDLLSTMFATIAQVSFTVTGLFFIAIAGDAETRRYWFTNRSRRQFLGMSLIFLVLPGLISIFGMISPPDNLEISIWPCSAAFWGFMLILMSFRFLRNRELTDVGEFQRLEGNYFPSRQQASLIGFLFMLIGIIGSLNWLGRVNGTHSDLFIGGALGVMTFLGIVSVWTLFSSEDVPNTINKTSKFAHSSSVTQSTGTGVNRHGINLLVALLLSIIGFLIGWLLFHQDKS